MAIAEPAGVAEPTGPYAAVRAAADDGRAGPGQTFEVRAQFANRGGVAVRAGRVAARDRRPRWTAAPAGRHRHRAVGWTATRRCRGRFTVASPPTRRSARGPYFSRAGLQESRYTLADAAAFGRPSRRRRWWPSRATRSTASPVRCATSSDAARPSCPTATSCARCAACRGWPSRCRRPTAVVPLVGRRPSASSSQVEVLHNAEAPTNGHVALTLPSGWTAEPAQHAAHVRPRRRAGQLTASPCRAATDRRQAYRVDAVATAEGRQYREGYELIEQRDLEPRYLYRPSTATCAASM